MSEHDMRDALRTTMTAVAPPPSMSADVALDAARRANLRRRVGWVGAGAAAVTVLVAAGVLVATGLDAPAVQPGGPQPGGGAGTGTEPAWPNGQEDRTARAGARYEQGVRLLADLAAAVPPGYAAPTEGTTSTGMPVRYHQAHFEDWVRGVESWSYMSIVTVSDGSGTGRMLAEVHTAPNTLPTDPCALAKQLWGMGGNCEVVMVGDKQVGVVVTPGQDRRFDQWAAYRHPDGVVVFIAQALNGDEAKPPWPASHSPSTS